MTQRTLIMGQQNRSMTMKTGMSMQSRINLFDVEEYDDVFSNYAEARARMNKLRLARGFYPVVALGPEATSGSTFNRNSGKKGKAKRGKGKGQPRK